MGNIKSTSELSFVFEGGYEVNALSVSRAIEGIALLTNMVSEHEFPDASVQLSVRAVSPGSLEVLFTTAAEITQTLFSHGGLAYAETIASLISHFFSLKSFLRGSAPKKIDALPGCDNVTIENVDGDKMIVPKSASLYFQKQGIDETVTYIVNNASLSTDVSGIRVESKGAKGFIPRELFPECSRVIQLPGKPEEEITYIRKGDILYIRKPDIIGDTPWMFKSDKNISASIQDKSFLEKVHKGKIAIAAGSYIIADLEVKMRKGKDGFPDEKSYRYSVLSVTEYMGLDEQMQMNAY